jgi:DNA-binding LytR/AlgR family response regulator
LIEAAICDDEPLLAGALERLLRDSAHVIPEPLRITVFTRGEDLRAALSAGDSPIPFDMLFLDIELGPSEAAANGIAIAAEIRKRSDTAILIFVSAHEAYCKELFRYDTFDFLSKPVDALQLQDALRRAYQRLKKPSFFFSYRIKNETYRVPFPEILYFEITLHKVRIVTRQGEREFYGKLDDVEAGLGRENPGQSGFVRVHHSLLVNLEHVEKIAKNNTLVLWGGRTVHLSRTYAGKVRQHMMAYFRETPL